MALLTYADLKTQVANWLARSDLTTYIDDFVTLFEVDANLRLSSRLQIATVTLAPDAVTGSVALPTDYEATTRVSWTGTPNVVLDYEEPDIFYFNYPTAATGTPMAYTVEGLTLTVRPVSSTPLTFVYKQNIAPLSTGVNWLYKNYPNAYLWGTLAEAQGFNIDMDKMALWTQRRDKVFDDIALLDFRERNALTMRPGGFTP